MLSRSEVDDQRGQQSPSCPGTWRLRSPPGPTADVKDKEAPAAPGVPHGARAPSVRKTASPRPPRPALVPGQQPPSAAFCKLRFYKGWAGVACEIPPAGTTPADRRRWTQPMSWRSTGRTAPGTRAQGRSFRQERKLTSSPSRLYGRQPGTRGESPAPPTCPLRPSAHKGQPVKCVAGSQSPSAGRPT